MLCISIYCVCDHDECACACNVETSLMSVKTGAACVHACVSMSVSSYAACMKICMSFNCTHMHVYVVFAARIQTHTLSACV